MLLAGAYLCRHDVINAEKYALEVIISAEYGLEALFTDANGENGNNGVESFLKSELSRWTVPATNTQTAGGKRYPQPGLGI